MSNRRPTIVIGLDGGHFEMFRPWIEDDMLPNFQRAITNGATGDLQSVLPPTTSPNWKVYATGKDPGKIGIFWWENIDTGKERIYYPSHRKRAHNEYWDHIATEETVGVLGVPLTHPPRPINGFQISGAPDGEDEGFTYPPALEEYLREEHDYRVTREHRLQENRNRAAEEVRELIDLRFRAAKDLFDRFKPSFMQITTFYLNSLHHYFWNDEPTRMAWQRIDEHLGEFLDARYNVILMSDHGSNEIETVFHINTWLEEQGYLTTKHTEVASAFRKLGLDASYLNKILSTVKIEGFAKQLAPDWLVRTIPTEQGVIHRSGKAQHIDWDATDAVASGQGPLYLTVDRGDSRYEPLREELIDALTGLQAPDGTTVVDEVHRGEEVYSAEYPSETPDLVLEQSNNVHIPGAIGADESFSTPSKGSGWRGENKRTGLFIATGPDFADIDIGSLSILDLAPTLLHLHCQAIPSDMDGKVRTEVFAAGSDPANREIVYDDVAGREQELAKARAVAHRIDH